MVNKIELIDVLWLSFRSIISVLAILFFMQVVGAFNEIIDSSRYKIRSRLRRLITPVAYLSTSAIIMYTVYRYVVSSMRPDESIVSALMSFGLYKLLILSVVAVVAIIVVGSGVIYVINRSDLDYGKSLLLAAKLFLAPIIDFLWAIAVAVLLSSIQPLVYLVLAIFQANFEIVLSILGIILGFLVYKYGLSKTLAYYYLIQAYIIGYIVVGPLVVIGVLTFFLPFLAPFTMLILGFLIPLALYALYYYIVGKIIDSLKILGIMGILTFILGVFIVISSGLASSISTVLNKLVGLPVIEPDTVQLLGYIVAALGMLIATYGASTEEHPTIAMRMAAAISVAGAYATPLLVKIFLPQELYYMLRDILESLIHLPDWVSKFIFTYIGEKVATIINVIIASQLMFLVGALLYLVSIIILRFGYTIYALARRQKRTRHLSSTSTRHW